ncbi:MAG: hypothetical protein H0S85_01275 [Desulfovibrionaceae bacterium]|jgi:hypothetical protein|nr:hypothetical protein [Desulfovibrionaceae bacterium]
MRAVRFPEAPATPERALRPARFLAPALALVPVLALMLVLAGALAGCGSDKDPVETAKAAFAEDFKGLSNSYRATQKECKSFERNGQSYTLCLRDQRGDQGLSFEEKDGTRVREKVLEFEGSKVRVRITGVGHIAFDLVP